jgi:hypothetical protein
VHGDPHSGEAQDYWLLDLNPGLLIDLDAPDLRYVPCTLVHNHTESFFVGLSVFWLTLTWTGPFGPDLLLTPHFFYFPSLFTPP